MSAAVFAVDASDLDLWMDAAAQRIFGAVREGMQEGMQGLAWHVADKLSGNPIQSRSGALLGAILGSPRVTETPTMIRGTVSSDVGKKHLGLWLEEGTHVPATGNPAAVLYEFTEPDGASFFTHGHAAFQVAPHPFLNPSLEEYAPTLTDIITARVTETVDAVV